MPAIAVTIQWRTLQFELGARLESRCSGTRGWTPIPRTAGCAVVCETPAQRNATLDVTHWHVSDIPRRLT